MIARDEEKSERSHPVVAENRKLPSLATVEPQEIEWLWHPWFPLGKLSLLAGDAGLGKSVLTLNIAARVSTGRPFQGNTEQCEPGDVMIASCEDDVADTIVPRLIAAGADRSRVFPFENLNDKPFVLNEDGIEDLAVEAERMDDLRLIVIDPAPAFLVGEGNSNTDVRRALRPLKVLAENLRVSVIMVSHLNKQYGGNLSALYRVIGSGAWAAAVRSCILVAADPKDPDRTLFLPVKCNLTKTPTGRAYKVMESRGQPSIVWDGTVEITANEALAPPPTRRSEAEVLILELLADGPLDSKILEQAILDAGISERTYQRARRKVGVVSEQIRGSNGKTIGRWLSRLPGKAAREKVGIVDSVGIVGSVDQIKGAKGAKAAKAARAARVSQTKNGPAKPRKATRKTAGKASRKKSPKSPVGSGVTP